MRDTVRAFVDDKVKPIIEECHRDARTPLELVPEMGALNLFGASISDYGLPGLGGVAYGLIMQELERGDSGLRSFVSVQSSLVMYPIYTFGSQEQKDRWIPPLATGEAIGCFGLTEPDFGSNPGGMRTTAKKVGDEWVLNGAKQWITNGTLADVAVVWAKTDGRRPRLPGREGDARASPPRDQHGKFSLRASTTSRARLRGLPHPGGRTCCPATTGLKSPLMCLNQARYGIAWGGVGSAMATYDTALDVRQGAHPVQRPADRLPPARAGEARLDGRPRSPRRSSSPASSAGSRTTGGSSRYHDLDGQAQQRLARPRVRQARPRDPRRQRHRRRLPGDPPHAQHRVGLHLRGDARHPRPDHRRGDHRHPGLQRAGALGRPKTKTRNSRSRPPGAPADGGGHGSPARAGLHPRHRGGGHRRRQDDGLRQAQVLRPGGGRGDAARDGPASRWTAGSSSARASATRRRCSTSARSWEPCAARTATVAGRHRRRSARGDEPLRHRLARLDRRPRRLRARRPPQRARRLHGQDRGRPDRPRQSPTSTRRWPKTCATSPTPSSAR